MLFHSYIFILVFLPLTVTGYFVLNRLERPTAAKLYLIGMSLWFYGYFNPAFLGIILASLIVNFCIGRYLPNRTGLALGLIYNLGQLFVFKYFDFFIGNINAAFAASLPLFELALPLGISFFTFQQVSYVVDACKKSAPRYRLTDYALFVVFFPQLIAGPIVRHDDMIPQFCDPSRKAFCCKSFAAGLMAFTLGLAKKLLLADVFGAAADAVYGSLPGLSAPDALVGMLSYTMQIYFDFSGYCDMAVGIGLMLNIRLPQNFDTPYRSRNVAEFWRRWHITLGAFLTEYLYIPLGGSRRSGARTALNVLIVFLVSGLWHGAGYTFLIWGLLHGMAVSISRRIGRPKNRALQCLSWLLTFAFLNVSWVFFRAETLGGAWRMLEALGRGGRLSYASVAPFVTPLFSLLISSVPRPGYVLAPLWLAAGLYLSVFTPDTGARLLRFSPSPARAAVCGALLFTCVLSLSGVSSFLYFNF